MKLDPILTKAIRLFRRGKYGETIRVLESEVVRYHDSFRYYYILGTACLYAKDFGGAFTYFKRAREIKLRDTSALLGQAALFLRRGETGRAVDLYLEVQDTDPRNRIARRALGVIRKYGGEEGISAWIEAGKLPRLYPPRPKLPLSPRSFIIPVLCLLGALALTGGLIFRFGGLPFFTTSRPNREGLAGSALEREDRDEPVQVGGSFRYILTRSQVLADYEAARTLFTEYRDEAAKVALNRIIESNAAEGVKNKARLLLSYTGVPGFDTLDNRDRFSYAQVMAEPLLYRDCYVIWRGMAANLKNPENATSFDFLVGYDTRNTLEGIVPVDFDFPVAVQIERPLEVLGRVVPVSADGGGEGIRLAGTAIHQSGLPGPAGGAP
jgi:tetratricopeptide (TPR) repeat protein